MIKHTVTQLYSDIDGQETRYLVEIDDAVYDVEVHYIDDLPDASVWSLNLNPSSDAVSENVSYKEAITAPGVALDAALKVHFS